MNRLPIAEVAFSGYRLLAAKPMVGVIWFGLHMAAGLAGSVIPVVLANAPEALEPAAIFALAIALLVFSVAAASRAGLGIGRPELGYLGLGKDEARLILTLGADSLILYILIMAAMVLWAVGALVSSGGSYTPPHWTNVPAALAAAPGVALYIFVSIQMSLAPARTLAEGAIRIFSWRLTRGHLWRLLAIYGLALAPAVAIGVVLFFAVLQVFGYRFGDEVSLTSPTYRTMREAFSLEPMVWCAYGALIPGLVIAVLAVAAGAAHARLSATTPIEDVF